MAPCSLATSPKLINNSFSIIFSLVVVNTTHTYSNESFCHSIYHTDDDADVSVHSIPIYRFGVGISSHLFSSSRIKWLSSFEAIGLFFRRKNRFRSRDLKYHDSWGGREGEGSRAALADAKTEREREGERDGAGPPFFHSSRRPIHDERK